MFEVKYKDILGRIGKLLTRNGTLETPAFLPVVNPRKFIVKPSEIYEMGFRALITNSYILYQIFGHKGDVELHSLYEYPGIIFTDSGGFQILKYGQVEVSSLEILRFQERIGTDVGTILDIPTGYTRSREEAELTVKETLDRAREACVNIENRDMVWMGPIQGGIFLDLVSESARQISEMPFQILALGSPVELMENYKFSELIDMMAAAKLSADPSKPIHLFGAGHPMLFAIAVAMGYDTFDSASYALFAREGRYMTNRGTCKISEMSYLPCSCPICSKRSLREMREMKAEELEKELALHNLYIIKKEIEEVKEAVVEGRLWDLIEVRARTHPALFAAFLKMLRYSEQIERYSPTVKSRGVYIFDKTSLKRPEIVSFRRKTSKYIMDSNSAGLVIVVLRPWWSISRITKTTAEIFVESVKRKRILLVFKPPIGVVPWQTLSSYPNDRVIYPGDKLSIKRFARENINQLQKILKGYKGEVEIRSLTDGPYERRVRSALEGVIKGYRKGEELG
jgi:7-cyano-7-deazaguanine tRNA-ribosyltransferase